MPATRSPKQRKISNSFQTVKSTRTASGKKGGKALTTTSKKNQSSVVHDIPDDTSSPEEDVGLVPLVPGSTLDIKRYHKYFKSLKPRFGNVPLIHAEGQNEVHQILRMFDLSYEYGPCVGVTRSERWERAQALGLNPPPEVKEILEISECQTDETYSQNVFYHEGI